MLKKGNELGEVLRKSRERETEKGKIVCIAMAIIIITVITFQLVFFSVPYRFYVN